MNKYHKHIASLLHCKCSLRESKYAKTKKEILDVFTEKLKKQHLEEISIKEICDEAQISEGTFYNYFPKKTDVLSFLISLWSVEVSWLAKKKEEETDSGIEAIKEIFSFTAREMQDKGPVMYEIISYISQMRKIIDVKDIGKAEKLAAFPDKDDIEKIKAQNIDGITKLFLEHAILKGELPSNINIASVQLTLRAIFFGTPLALTQEHVDKIEHAYHQGLNIFWKSIKNN